MLQLAFFLEFDDKPTEVETERNMATDSRLCCHIVIYEGNYRLPLLLCMGTPHTSNLSAMRFNMDEKI